MSEAPSSADVRSAASGFKEEAFDGLVRRTLLRRLIDVVALPASRGSAQDRSIAADLLLELLIEAEVGVRELCARRLQHMSQAPKRLLRFLALDVPQVAEIILSENGAFDEADLSDIVSHGAAPHRIACARRRDVGPAVATAIAMTGDAAAMKALLENPHSRLSERSVDLMVASSRDIPTLTSMLIRREELRPAHALAMFWWSGAHERRQILLRFSAERTILIDTCADLFRDPSSRGDPLVRKALQVIERRQRDRSAIERSSHGSLEAAVLGSVPGGLTPDGLLEIAAHAGIKPATCERITQDIGGEALAVLSKATGLKRDYLRAFWRALRREDDGSDYRRVEEIYDSIAVAKAQTVLRYWNWLLPSSFNPSAIAPEDDVNGPSFPGHMSLPEAVIAGSARGR